MAGKSTQRVIVELPDELRSQSDGANTFLPPCMLGFSLALVLVFVPLFSGVYWACKDIDPNPQIDCPRVVSKDSKSGPLGFLNKRKANELVLELPAPVPPLECSCRLLWNTWRSLAFRPRAEKSPQDSSTLPLTCIPGATTDVAPTQQEPKPDPQLLKQYASAFTPERLPLTQSQKSLISKLHGKVTELIPDFERRSSSARWGGHSGHDWFAAPRRIGEPTDMERLGGGKLYFSYLRIMKWPGDLKSKFPFKLCSKGCDAAEALRHTLEFREKYRPWEIAPSVKQENSRGAIYFHGFSHPHKGDDKTGHALVWVRPGKRSKVDDISFTRAYVNTLEMAVAASMKRSDGRIGKFNAIVDGSDFSWGLLPSRHQLHTFVVMLQDHYPDRLGMILLTNLGRFGEFVAKLLLPLLSEEVRAKVHVLPHDNRKRRLSLEAVMPLAFVPEWLGGSDHYKFDADEYYSDKSILVSEDRAKEYLTTMPYHS